MLNLEKSAAAFAEAKTLMPGGVNSPVRSYANVTAIRRSLPVLRVIRSMTSMATSTSIMSAPGDLWSSAMRIRMW